jgi:pentatricopeptide repeat protein
MKTHDVKPTVVTYNSMISMYARAQNAQKVTELYHLLEKESSPDMATFAILLDFFKQADKMEDMSRVLLVMSEMGYVPTFTKYLKQTGRIKRKDGRCQSRVFFD